VKDRALSLNAFLARPTSTVETEEAPDTKEPFVEPDDLGTDSEVFLEGNQTEEEEDKAEESQPTSPKPALSRNWTDEVVEAKRSQSCTSPEPASKPLSRNWTDAEVEALKAAVFRYGEKWSKIKQSKHFLEPLRRKDQSQLRQKWRQMRATTQVLIQCVCVCLYMCVYISVASRVAPSLPPPPTPSFLSVCVCVCLYVHIYASFLLCVGR
jgi:hypothetical protein